MAALVSHYQPDHMGLLMFSEHKGPREGLATEAAFERLLSSVVSHVVSVEMHK